MNKASSFALPKKANNSFESKSSYFQVFSRTTALIHVKNPSLSPRKLNSNKPHQKIGEPNFLPLISDSMIEGQQKISMMKLLLKEHQSKLNVGYIPERIALNNYTLGETNNEYNFDICEFTCKLEHYLKKTFVENLSAQAFLETLGYDQNDNKIDQELVHALDQNSFHAQQQEDYDYWYFASQRKSISKLIPILDSWNYSL